MHCCDVQCCALFCSGVRIGKCCLGLCNDVHEVAVLCCDVQCCAVLCSGVHCCGGVTSQEVRHLPTTTQTTMVLKKVNVQ